MSPVWSRLWTSLYSPRLCKAARLAPVWTAILMAIVIGCGGSGGGGSSTGSTSTTGRQVTYSNPQTYGGVPGATQTTQPDDLTQLVAGDQVYLGASATVNGDGASYTTQLSPYNYVVAGGPTVATVTVSGVMTVVTSTPGTYTVSATSVAGTLTWTFVVTQPLSQPIVTGQVIENPGGLAVAGVTVYAFTSSNTVITSVQTDSNGFFSLPAGSGATSFSVDVPGLVTPPTYQSVYEYGAASRNLGNSACNPPLPAVTTNHHYPLPHYIVLNIAMDANGTVNPPVPPASCLVQP